MARMNARRAVRWTLQHGLARRVLTRAARQGDPQALLVMDADTRAHPYALHDTVRAAGPLLRGRLSWVSTNHAACKEVLRSDDFRTGPPETPLSGLVARVAQWSAGQHVLHPVEPPSLLAVDGEQHARYRRLVSRVFSARAVEALRGDVTRTADRLLDELAASTTSEVDLVERYATLLPLTVISDILGVPEADRPQVLTFGAGAAPSLDVGLSWSEFSHVDTSLRAFDAWLGTHLQRLRENPGTDLLSQLVVATDDGRRLSEDELRATAGLLLAAGFETTVNLIGSGTELLLRHPDQLAKLRAEPERWGNAVEEVLRHESPVQVTARVALRDTSVQGVAVRKGHLVATMLAGANRDPAVFTDPHAFQVDRANAREHLSFSAGRHFCLGAALARIEGEVGLRALFERFPELALAPGAQRRPTRVLRGWERLPVRLGTLVG
jgi:cytochrome P450